MRWLALTASLVPVTLLICIAGAVLAEGVEDRALFNALFFFMLGAVPSSIGVAVLCYRLYDVDRVINRTLVYGVLTALLGATYAAATLVLGTALGERSAWVTASATLLAAVAFRPLRARVQDAVDRRFEPRPLRRAAPHQALSREAARRGGRARGGRAAAARRPSDPGLELRYWLPESEVYVDGRGRAVTDRPGDERVRTAVMRAGVPLGMVVHQEMDEERPGMLQEVVEAALFEDAGHEVVAAHEDARRLPATVSAHRPDLVVVDIRMPPTFTDEGARAAREIKHAHPGIGMLVLSQHIETQYAVELVSLGGFGYLLKGRVLRVADFLAAAQRVADGGSALDPKVVRGPLPFAG